MIILTKMDGKEFYLNYYLIEKIDEVPNTIITMNSQIQYLVKESVFEIEERIAQDKKKKSTK